MKIYDSYVGLLCFVLSLSLLGCEDKGTTTVKTIQKETRDNTKKDLYPSESIEMHGSQMGDIPTSATSSKNKIPHPTIAQNDKSAVHTGKVVELLSAAPYLYLKIKEGDKEYWIAAPEADIEKGSEVVFEEQMMMQNFHSKALNRQFDSVMFASALQPKGALNKSETKKIHMQPFLKKELNSTGSKPMKSIKIDGAMKLYTIKEIYDRSSDLNNTQVSIKGNVVKVLGGIMGRNWIHIQDGTGSSAGADDIVFTSPNDTISVGDEVIATGILKTSVDFGYGYTYDVIIENANFKK